MVRRGVFFIQSRFSWDLERSLRSHFDNISTVFRSICQDTHSYQVNIGKHKKRHKRQRYVRVWILCLWLCDGKFFGSVVFEYIWTCVTQIQNFERGTAAWVQTIYKKNDTVAVKHNRRRKSSPFWLTVVLEDARCSNWSEWWKFRTAESDSKVAKSDKWSTYIQVWWCL